MTSDELNWSIYFDAETAQLLVHSLGNLTLLFWDKNIRASNRNYMNKQEIYQGKGLGGKTSFAITQEILKNYPNEWNETAILNCRNSKYLRD